jgi:uncharacterized protein YbaP (TraB family)
MTVTVEIKDEFLPDFVKMVSKNKNIKIINEDLLDYYLFEEAKKDKKNVKDIDTLLKEYNIES